MKASGGAGRRVGRLKAKIRSEMTTEGGKY